MADSEWELGAAAETITVAMPFSTRRDRCPPAELPGGSYHPVEEIFRVTNHKKGCVIRATRPRDHVDLVFHIRGMKCTGLGSERTQPRLTAIKGISDRKIRILFSPQHIAEQIKVKPLGDGACESARTWGAMQVRMSQSSRLVFLIPDKAKWIPTCEGSKIMRAPYVVLDELTDWSRLAPKVHKRANVKNEIGDQLEAAFPDYNRDTLQNLDFETAKGLIVEQLEGPGEGETALEMAGRLIFSPSSAGRWVVPDELPESRAAPLWTARLNQAGRSTVRALWSSRFKPKAPEIPPTLNEPNNTCGPMLSLSRQNHWEIVLQTSVYGLPALRSLPPESAKASQQVENDLNTPAIPRHTVVRPDVDVCFLNEIDHDKNHNYSNQDSGIAIARPFDDADISISALGGLSDMTWRGDPPSIFWTPDGDPIGLRLERLFYRGYLGRDTEVVAVDKGYLFPLGIRASLVTVHERVTYPDPDDNPASYLISRQFIVAPRKPHIYPGPYQPFEGREFPPRRVQLQTLVTPDLANLDNLPLQLPRGSDPLPENSIFWPQTAQCSTVSDILFEWSTEDAVSVRSKFVFVLNDVVRRQDAMRALVDYYNAEAENRRTAWLGGARHRYAEPNREGDTSFDTTSWLLSAQGRRDGLNGEEHFASDGRMEGASQPPFYPRMERGLVSMQSIEQMLGIPHGQVEVRYFEGYKRDGIDPKHQIFLTLGQGGLPLRASGRPERSGGIASPDLKVAAISRLTGPVGGGGATNSVLATGDPDFGSAVKGIFDPDQFFRDAKLLGVVSLSRIIAGATADLSLNQAPRLVDETLFGARDEFALLQKVATDLFKALYGPPRSSGLVASLEEGISKAEQVLQDADDLHLASVYPSLTHAMAPLRGEPAVIETSLKAIASAKTPEAVRDLVETLVPEIRALLDAIADVVKDPVPDKFEETIAKVRGVFEDLVRGAKQQARGLAAETFTLLLDWLKGSFCHTVDAEAFGRILFGELGADRCEKIFDDQSAALRAISDGLYGAVFDKAWASLAPILEIENDLRARVDLELERMRETVNAALRAGVALIAARLKALDPALEDIRDQTTQSQFVSDVIGDLKTLLRPPGDSMSPKEALDFATSALAQLSSRAPELINSRLAGLLPTIQPINSDEALVLLNELSDYVRLKLEDEVISRLNQSINRLAERLASLVASGARSWYERIFEAVGSLFDAISESSRIADVAEAGRGISAVCDAVGDVAILIGDGVMVATAGLSGAAQAIIDAAARIQVPADPVGRPLRVALASLTSAAQQTLILIGSLDAERQKIRQTTGNVCTSTHDHLDPVAAVIRIRESLIDSLTEIARQCEAINEKFTSAQPSEDDRAALVEAIEQCATLVWGITGISELRTPSQILNDAIAEILRAELGTDKYRAQLSVTAAEVTAGANALYAELSQRIGAGRLRELLDEGVRNYQSALDHKLAGFLLQSVGFTNTALDAIKTAIGEALFTFARIFLPIHCAINSVLKLALDGPQDEILYKVYWLALGGTAKTNDLKAVQGKLENERILLEAILKSDDPGLAQVEPIVNEYRNGRGALRAVIDAFETLGFVDMGQALTEALREELRKIEGELRALVTQLVPTKLQTRYFWATQLNCLLDSKGDWIFKPKCPGTRATLPHEPPSDYPDTNWHLCIGGRFSFDVVTGQREVDIIGVLRPFELKLLGEQFHMLTIAFDETRFTSRNGAAPDFAVKVKSVTIGPYLQFIKKLEEWLIPKGSGFYLKPVEDFPGIEVGYVYDAGIILIGSLQFINVAFRICAKLPYSKDSESNGEAQFVFALASRERPFLISSPPYGGGGWVKITCTAEQVKDIDLSFVFGGVAAIRFGPLNAQGRIVAGIRVQSRHEKDSNGNQIRTQVITAIFEAVGEGSVACFSIGVSIRVTLYQKTNGALYGETTYQFSFKVGFVRLKYRVKAHYRLSNDSSPRAMQASRGSAAIGMSLFQMIVPSKETEWQAYRRYFDLELLEAA